MGGLLVAVARTAQFVWRSGLAHPHADLKGPFTQRIGEILFSALEPLQLQCADQGGSTAELIEGEQPQGVAHQHGEAG